MGTVGRTGPREILRRSGKYHYDKKNHTKYNTEKGETRLGSNIKRKTIKSHSLHKISGGKLNTCKLKKG